MVLPEPLTTAAFAMAVLGWYTSVRTTLQLVYLDLKAVQSVDADIEGMAADLRSQNDEFDRWAKEWYISDHTPERVLEQYWGSHRTGEIQERIVRLRRHLMEAQKSLPRRDGLDRDTGPVIDPSTPRIIGKIRRSAKQVAVKAKYLAFKKAYIITLISYFSPCMDFIRKESKAGWEASRQILLQELRIPSITPYHIQVYGLLLKISRQIQPDAEALNTTWRSIEQVITILMDLDIFNSSSPYLKYENVLRITKICQAGHLKLEFLLREVNQHQRELTRVIVERVRDTPASIARDINAFRTILDSPATDPLDFIPYGSGRAFRISKIRRQGISDSKLEKTYGEVLADSAGPIYNRGTKKYEVDVDEPLFGDKSNARVGFELTQMCFLFLRNNWIAENICPCHFRCGKLESNHPTLYHFGFDIASISSPHQPRKWRNPHRPTQYIHGSAQLLWCAESWHGWTGLNKSLRYLGLLLVEFALGYAVYPKIEQDNNDGAAKVTGILILYFPVGGSCRWKDIGIKELLRLVKSSFNNDANVAEAIRYCLVSSFPPNPTDSEWEIELQKFFYVVVKPFMDLYEHHQDPTPTPTPKSLV